MSMSDDVQRAGAPKKEGSGLKNPYASAGAGQSGGKPATGLPGLAAFGQMQTYTPQTAQPRQTQQPEQPEALEPEQYAAPQREPAHEQPSHEEAPAYEETFSEEQDFAADQPAGQEYAFEREEAYEQDQAFLAESAPEFMQPHEQSGRAAEANPYAYPGNDDAHAEQGPELSFNDLTDIYRNGSNSEAGDDAAYEFTADDLQSYMASNAQSAHEDHGSEEEEDFDLSKHMSLQPFEARYDQQRPVNLGGYDDEPGEQPFFHPEQEGDADFLSSEEADEQMPPQRERKSRRALMFASGLIGALALGGALAFAYKMTGGETQVADGSGPPLIKADDSPVKVAPDEPGGKQFAHQNKQIYDRLQGDQKPEVERIVPRQEAVQDAPPATTAGAAVAAPNDGGPHRVRTLKVMPDGSVVVSAPPDEAAPAPSAAAQQAPAQPMPMPMQSAQPSIPALPAPGSEMAGVAVTMPPEPQPQADQTIVASVPPAQQQVAAQPEQQQQLSSETTPAPMPQPKPAAPARQTASMAPQQAAQASSGSGYAVQVASRRSQAMALAAFADLQQKYTSLLGDYQPMIQSADLGDKGVWYRLRVGPISQKAQADDLCNNLKKAGLRSCLVRPL